MRSLSRIAALAAAQSLAIGLAGCTSFQSFKTSPLEADPHHVQLAIVMPKDLVLKKGDVVLSLAWQPKEGAPLKGDYHLDVADGAARPDVPVRVAAGQHVRLVYFGQTDAENFRKLRLFILDRKARGQEGRGSIAVDFRSACWNGDFPADGRPLPISAYIRMAPDEAFTEVVSPTDVRKLAQQWRVASIPSCAPSS